jgi:hypothetical protein
VYYDVYYLATLSTVLSVSARYLSLTRKTAMNLNLHGTKMNPLTVGLRKSKPVAGKSWIGDFLYGSVQTDQAAELMI